MPDTLTRHGHYIDGTFRPALSGETFISVNPATERPLYEAASGAREDVNAAVLAAQQAFESASWRDLTPTARGRLLRKLAELVAENAGSLAMTETQDNGKLFREMKGQLEKVPEYFHYFAGLADKVYGETPSPFELGSFTYTLREPLGVVGAITPWNSPVLLAAYKIAPALAMGNTVVVKPSEHTSASMLQLATLFEQAGFPPGVLNVVTGAGAAGAALAAHPGVAKVSFTGGTATGRMVAQAAAGHFVNAALELGGKSPQLVFPDADPVRAARGIVSGIFAAAGQTCIAGSRAFVHESLYDEVTERVVSLAEEMRIGDPLDVETDMGPLCFEGHRTRVENFVDHDEAMNTHSARRRDQRYDRGARGNLRPSAGDHAVLSG